MSLRGLFSGLLTLTFLQVVLSSTKSAERTAGVLSVVGSGFERLMSPTVAAIPDLRTRKQWRERTTPETSSSTLPDDWTTKPAAPSPPASAYT